METAILKIVKDRPPPKIVAQAALEAFLAHRPINSVVAAVPGRRVRHLDVDAILARSLPKVAGKFRKGRMSESALSFVALKLDLL